MRDPALDLLFLGAGLAYLVVGLVVIVCYDRYLVRARPWMAYKGRTVLARHPDSWMIVWWFLWPVVVATYWWLSRQPPEVSRCPERDGG